LNQPRIDDAVKLMRRFGVATLDDFITRIEGRIYDDGDDGSKRYSLRVERIRSAKIATEVLFSSLESAARGSFVCRDCGSFRIGIYYPTHLDCRTKRWEILVSGYFGTVNDLPLTRIARLNKDGALDPSFATNLSLGPMNGPVVALQTDGKILVGGNVWITENGVCTRWSSPAELGWCARYFSGGVRAVRSLPTNAFAYKQPIPRHQ
jgi:hypothetical protein